MRIQRHVRQENSLSKRRLAYALAAGAASTGVCMSDANAAISYSGIQDISISQFNKLNLLVDDQDENVDIFLKNYVFGGGNYQGATVSFYPGLIVGFHANELYYVSALEAGALIDATTMGPKFFGTMSYGDNNPGDQFDNITNAYIGLGFPINASPGNYYGWVRVSIDNAAGTFIVHDWAYQTEQGVGILAGDVGTVTEPTGDFNDDGTVDAADYAYWRKAIDTPEAYEVWKSQFGQVLSGSASSAPSGAIPEPMTLGLLAAGSLGLAFLRRSRRGSS